MTPQEAIEIATRYVRERAIDTDGVKGAFFVLRSRIDPIPGEKDVWVVHFKYPDDPAKDCDPEAPLIISIDPETRVAKVTATL